MSHGTYVVLVLPKMWGRKVGALLKCCASFTRGYQPYIEYLAATTWEMFVIHKYFHLDSHIRSEGKVLLESPFFIRILI